MCRKLELVTRIKALIFVIHFCELCFEDKLAMLRAAFSVVLEPFNSPPHTEGDRRWSSLVPNPIPKEKTEVGQDVGGERGVEKFPVNPQSQPWRRDGIPFVSNSVLRKNGGGVRSYPHRADEREVRQSSLTLFEISFLTCIKHSRSLLCGIRRARKISRLHCNKGRQ